MFFSGDSSNGKHANLGGRSSTERVRRNALAKTPLGRKQLRDEETAKRIQRKMKEEESERRLKSSAALRIQKGFRAIKAVRMEKSKQRQEFLKIYGKNLSDVDRIKLGPDYVFLRQFLYFFNAEEIDDILVLVKICQSVLCIVGNVDKSDKFAGEDYSSKCDLVNYRMKKLAYACICALPQDGNQLKDLSESKASAIPLLEVLVLLIDLKLPWSCGIVEYLSQNKGFRLLREFILLAKDNSEKCLYSEKGPALEDLLTVVLCHIGQKPCTCSVIDIGPQYSFTSQILTIPSLWHVFPNLKKVVARQCMIRFIISSLPKDVSDKCPTFHRLIGNIFETGGVPLSGPDIPYDVTIDLAAVTTFLLPVEPSLTRSDSRERNGEYMTGYVGDTVVALDGKLDQQSCDSMDNRLFLGLTKKIFTEIYYAEGPYDIKVVAIGAVSAFLYVIFNTFPLERIMFNLAYRSGFIPVLWDFMKRCQEGGKLSSFSDGGPNLLLPLAVFCPVYNDMLKILDIEEFYKLEKPLSLKDIKSLVILLKQALWQLMWENHTSSANLVRSLPVGTTNERLSNEAIQQQVIIVASELLSQLHDWNNRQEFTSPSDFHADGVNDFFISQTVIGNTQANEILKKAPFLIPFTSRVEIFKSQAAAAKTSNENRITIRRDHFLEDAVNSMSQLSEVDLRGKIRVTYVNEHGIQEAGIDLGGLFKDFMENTIRDSFDVQYGLFEETTDHLLYPNPESGMKHEQHLQFFHFLGTLLAKAMFEGILVGLPFAAFFLRKFKEKNDYLKDLRSLDPELYHHLIFVKFYEGDFSKLDLYFVILDNEYGDLVPAELRPNGKNQRVTKENVIPYIDLVANHRLHYQIRQQSSPLLRGIQQRIQKDWIDRFDKHKLQAMFEEILVDLPLTTFFWRLLKQKHNYLNDLPSLDPEEYNSLMFLKSYEGDVSKLELNGENEQEELLPDAMNLQARDENVIFFVYFRANYLLNYQIRQQCSYFLRGFQQLIKEDWIHMFSEHEFQRLISGPPGSLDVDNLQQHTKYKGYDSEDRVIKMFWEVLGDFSKEDKENFLKFVTGCSRGPLLGFRYLEHLFCIQRTDGDALDRLPTAATCFNTLKLPPYESKDQLSTKLVQAINADAGFDWS